MSISAWRIQLRELAALAACLLPLNATFGCAEPVDEASADQ